MRGSKHRRGGLLLVTSHRRRRVKRGLFSVFGYLVDPASSHMLVSKIKPCRSMYKPL